MRGGWVAALREVGLGRFCFRCLPLSSTLSGLSALLWIFAACFLAATQPGVAEELRFSGYLKSFFTVLDSPSIGALEREPLEGVGLNRLRLRVLWEKRAFATELAYELAPRVQGDTGWLSGAELPRPAPLSYRAFDLRSWVYPARGRPEGSFALPHNLDRASITFSAAVADFSVGRQPVAFGSARVLNPTDIIAPFTYEELDKEERVGVDAVRVRVPTGDLSELDAGVVFGDKFKPAESAVFVRGRFYLREADVAPVVVIFRENLLLGVNMARALGGAVYWLEAGYTLAGIVDDYQKEESYARFSTGLDYSFASKLYGFAEYHLNGAGSGRAASYLGRLGRRAYTEGRVYLLGRHYIAPGLIFQATPLLVAHAHALVNMSDGSAFLAPRLEYSFSEDVFVEVGALEGLGRGVKTRDAPLLPAPRSEFGLYPDIYFSSMRLYF